MRGFETAFWATAGRDAESRQSKAGNAFVTINAAVDVGTDEDGKSTSQWVKVLCFGKIAESAALIKKGSRIYAEGTLQIGTWKTHDGETRLDITLKAWKCEVVARIGKDRPRAEGQKLGEGFNAPLDRMKQPAERQREFEDEIPF